MKNEVKNKIDQEISDFEIWFKSVGNSSLSRYELAILRTYLAAAVTKKFKSSLLNQEKT